MWRGPHGGDQRAICQLNSQTSSSTTCSQHAWGQFWPSRLPVLPPSTSHEAEKPSNQISELWDIVSCCFMQLCFGVINYQISNAYFYSDLNIYIYFQAFPGGSVIKNPPAYAGDMGLSPDLGGSLMSQSNKAHEPQQLSLCSRVWELQLLNPHAPTTKAQVPQCPCSARREASTMRSPLPPLAATREKPVQQQRTSTAKKKKKIIYIKFHIVSLFLALV